MTDDEKLISMFTKVHGEMTGSCYLEIEDDDTVNVMKDGNLCWSVTKLDLLFDLYEL